MNISIKLNRII